MTRMIAILLFVVLAFSTHGATFTVNDPGDGGDAHPGDGIAQTASGVITLRAALEEANAHAGADTILFSTSGSITPAIPLPALSDPSGATTIDGGGAITLDGSMLPTEYNYASCIYVQSANNVIRGLIIVRFPYGGGIVLSGASATGNMIRACRIGTDGNAALPNLGRGITIDGGSNNTIGGTTTGDGNIISGNEGYGIYIEGSGNVIQGNTIGADATGTKALGNWYGISISGGADNLIGGTAVGAGNLISGNRADGISIEGDIPWVDLPYRRGVDLYKRPHGNIIQGNRIGTNAAGTAPLGNWVHGVAIANGAYDNLVGGTTPGAANLISGNGLYGVAIMGTQVEGPSALTTGNQVRRNSIHHNWSYGIAVRNKANRAITMPVIKSLNPIQGIAPSGSTVEIFADDDDEYETYLDTVTADAEGHFTSAVDLSPYPGKKITATATDAQGDTSGITPNAAHGAWRFYR